MQSGRRVNDGMGAYVAQRVAGSLDGKGGSVNILGVTFKENVPDTRNTQVVDIVRKLGKAGIATQLHDPQADGELLREEYGLTLTPLEKLRPPDAVIVAVAPNKYRPGSAGAGPGRLKPAGRVLARAPAPLRPGA